MSKTIAVPKIDDAGVAFGDASVLPKFTDLPAEFREWHREFHCDVASKLFFTGGSLADYGLKVRDGLDRGDVMRALRACLGSWEPKHEHKIAGVGYLLSQWCEKV